MTLIKSTASSSNLKQKTAKVPIDQIKVDIYARTKLNDDRVMHFAILYEEDPEKVTPIEITPDFSLTAGRHRLEGATIAGLKEINCVIVAVASKAEQMERAILENIDPTSSLPPTKADLIMSIKLLIKLGTPLFKVTELMLKIYPDKIAKAYVQEARHGIARDSTAAAVRDITDNDMSLSASAAKHNVKIESLKEVLGKKKKSGKMNVGEFKKLLSTQFRSQGQKISKILENVVKEYENTNMNKTQVLEVFEYFETYTGRQKTRIKEMKDRFTNMS